jgi:hypothetical protein
MKSRRPTTREGIRQARKLPARLADLPIGPGPVRVIVVRSGLELLRDYALPVLVIIATAIINYYVGSCVSDRAHRNERQEALKSAFTAMTTEMVINGNWMDLAESSLSRGIEYKPGDVVVDDYGRPRVEALGRYLAELDRWTVANRGQARDKELLITLHSQLTDLRVKMELREQVKALVVTQQNGAGFLSSYDRIILSNIRIASRLFRLVVFSLSKRESESGTQPSLTSLHFLRGRFYEKGFGGSSDYEMAHLCYEEACQNGIPAGCNNLGRLYAEGLGVKKDGQKALSLFRSACDGGDAAGCTNLGRAYENGLGTAKDLQVAAMYYGRACEFGDPMGCNNQAALSGRSGVDIQVTSKEIAEQFEDACNKGEAVGCYNLGVEYANGTTIPKDIEKAKYYLKLSCDGGYEPGCKALSGLK